MLAVGAGCAPGAAGREVAGEWRGTATLGGSPLPISVHFEPAGDSVRATFSTPGLMLLDQPLAEVEVQPPRVRFAAAQGDEEVRFEGRLSGDSIRGRMRLSHPEEPGEGLSVPFALGRAPREAPRPYRTEEVVFQAPGGPPLAGTLYLPSTGVRKGAIVLVHGSSLNLRDAYRFHADRFARAGVAALVYDKRGSGASGGDLPRATLDDLVGDAAAAVALLAARPEVDPGHIGVWGLSQGGIIAPQLAARGVADFVVTVSGPGVSFGETAAFQDSVRVARRGFPPTDAAAAARAHRALTEWIRTGEGEEELRALLGRTAELPWRRHTGIPRTLPTAAERVGWYWASRPLDPAEAWRQVRVPALVLLGDADDLVPAEASAEAIRQALREAGNDSSRVVVFPGADHMMRLPPPRGANGPAGWPRPAPGSLELVTEWVAGRGR